VGHLFSLALLFLLLHAQFLAAAQLIVYAGAVMVLYVFVVAYIGGQDEPLGPEVAGIRKLGAVFAAAVGAELCIAIIGSGLSKLDTKGAHIGPGFGTPAQIGTLLLTKFLLPFEIASFLLLIAAVGAVALARRRGGIIDEVAEAGRISVAQLLRPAETGTMMEAVGAGTHPAASPLAPGRTSGERERGPDEGAGW
jgi:NADH-quinone oxidoreductase subunit J